MRQRTAGADIRVQVQKQVRNEDGEIEQRSVSHICGGDRILFTRNDKKLGVQNGSLGYVTALSEQEFAVVFDDGRTINFTAAAYGHIAPGRYDDPQVPGQTVDRAYVRDGPLQRPPRLRRPDASP